MEVNKIVGKFVAGEAYATLLHDAAQVVFCEETFLRGEMMNRVCFMTNASVLVGKNGQIQCVAPANYFRAHQRLIVDEMVDCSCKTILPGFIDCHTHPVWAGDRVHEFGMKLAGKSYMEVHKMGGGISFTVEHTRRASSTELHSLLIKRLNRMVALGTTTVECKSGYGLDCETEMKMLKVLERAKTTHPIHLLSTFLGAHSVPKGKTAEEQCNDVISVQLPELKRLYNMGIARPKFIDVFCEKGVFDTAQSEKILRAGRVNSLIPNFHGDELNPMDAAQMAVRVEASALSHCECISDVGIDALAKSLVAAVLLPSTSHILRIEHAPARKLIDRGAIVAIATDFNPNAHCMSMPWVMHNSCVQLRMTLPEAFNAATVNAAYALRCEDVGRIDVGCRANIVVLDAPTWEHVMYEFEPPIEQVYIDGKRVK